MEKTYYLPAEWYKQSYIQLTWPHADTDWAYMLDEVETCYRNSQPPAPVARGSRISGSLGRLPLS